MNLKRSHSPTENSRFGEAKRQSIVAFGFSNKRYVSVKELPSHVHRNLYIGFVHNAGGKAICVLENEVIKGGGELQAPHEPRSASHLEQVPFLCLDIWFRTSNMLLELKKLHRKRNVLLEIILSVHLICLRVFR